MGTACSSRKEFAMMLHKLIAYALIALLPGMAVAAPSAQAILSASDAIRNPDKPFGLTVTLVEYRNGRQTDSTTLGVYSKADANSCLLYTSDAADDLLCVDLGGRRIIKKKK